MDGKQAFYTSDMGRSEKAYDVTPNVPVPILRPRLGVGDPKMLTRSLNATSIIEEHHVHC